MEILTLTLGKATDRDISFAEGLFSKNDENFYIFAITSDELTLLVRSELSLTELMVSIQEAGEVEFEPFDCNIVSWSAESKCISTENAELDIEGLLAYCMESDMEAYQCWYHDGNEGLYEASEADDGLAFVIVHDLVSLNNFENVRTMAEDDEDAVSLIAILDELNFTSDEE